MGDFGATGSGARIGVWVAALALVSAGCGSRTGLLDPDPLATPPPPLFLDASVPEDAGVDAGDAATDAEVDPLSPPIEDLDPVRTVSAGLFHTCVATRSGRTLCWGFNNLGQLGDGTNENRTVPVPTIGIRNAVSVTAGRSHSCALLDDGSVRCWGNNSSGELGSGTPESRHLSPVPVRDFEFDEAMLEISAGGEHTCGAGASGLIFCWGSNDNGQVGPDARGSYRQPIWARLEERTFNVAAGFEHTCVLGASGVLCWGEAAIERTRPRPDDEIAPPFLPTAVPNLPRALDFLDSGDFMSCAVDRPNGVSDPRGDVWCWGFERGEDDLVRPSPAERVDGIRDAVEVSVGHEFACARTSTGGVRCWGNNERGQLGDGGDETNPAVPVTPEGLPRTVQVTAGWRHACALDEAGVVRCWGRNQEGQLGDGRGGEYRLPTIAAVIRE